MFTRPLNFLVVEDHAFQRDMLVRMLQGLRARHVHTAADGRQALQVLSELPIAPDIILTDLNMPGMDGIEFIRHVGLSGSGASVIIVSALQRSVLSSVGTMARAYGVDLVGFVEKPVTPRKLEELINRHSPAAAQAPETPARRSFSIDEILHGLQNGEFDIFMQAKVEVATSRFVGAEALARWHHPDSGVLGPEAFIPVLEQSGQIHLLFREVLRKATTCCRSMRDGGHPGVMCVNLSLKQLTDIGLAEEIMEAVREAGIEPRDMVLEVAESAATSHMGAALENLARLRMKGFGLAIDDYGTGYASLEQLTRIPFNQLKIDQSFVRHAVRQEPAKVILESSIELARKLKIKAVAEGVETQANWDLLAELGCDIAQGYYISRPLPRELFLDWLENWPKLQSR